MKKVKLADVGEMLEFENFSTFEKTVQEFGKISTEEKQKFKKNDLGINFRSLSSYFTKMNEEYFENQIKNLENKEGDLDPNLILVNIDGDNHLRNKVIDSNLANFLNTERKVLIGNKIYTYNYDNLEILDLKSKSSTTYKFERKFMSKNKNSRKIAAVDYCTYNGRDYKILLLNEFGGYCPGEASQGCLSAIHAKKFWGTYYTNQTNYVNIDGSLNKGLALEYTSNGCFTCGRDYNYLTEYSSCTGCSSRELHFGGNAACYNGFSAFAAFNCDDNQARQLYL